MRRIMKAAVVGAMAAGLLGGGVSAALADGITHEHEDSEINMDQCLVGQDLNLGEIIAPPTDLPTALEEPPVVEEEEPVLPGEETEPQAAAERLPMLDKTCEGNVAVVTGD